MPCFILSCVSSNFGVFSQTSVRLHQKAKNGLRPCFYSRLCLLKLWCVFSQTLVCPLTPFKSKSVQFCPSIWYVKLKWGFLMCTCLARLLWLEWDQNSQFFKTFTTLYKSIHRCLARGICIVHPKLNGLFCACRSLKRAYKIVGLCSSGFLIWAFGICIMSTLHTQLDVHGTSAMVKWSCRL